MARWPAVFVFCGAIIALCGCRAPAPVSAPTQMSLRIPDYESFLDTTLSVLRRCDFQPERVDRQNGIAVAGPTTGGQWFEWWRVDSQGAYPVLESSLHTIRRVVTVRVEPRAPGESADEYRVSVQVDKSRFSGPQRQVTTASGGLAIYNERLPTTEGLRGAATRGDHWLPLGRDGLLEAYLLGRIVETARDVEPLVEPLPPAGETPGTARAEGAG